MSDASVYDDRYSDGYRETLDAHEMARWAAVDHFITTVLKLDSPQKVLDYGAGSGLHVDLWEKVFPQSELHFCDISRVGRDRFESKYPNHAHNYRLLGDDHPSMPEQTFDVVVSIEVLEHVADLEGYLRDIHRLLRPGGHFIWTTPCGNRLSTPHLYSLARGKIQQTDEGYRRWEWEDPTHLRRLRTGELRTLLRNYGYSNITFRLRSHFFAFASNAPGLRRIKAKHRLMMLDYNLLRRLPNGGSMIGAAQRPL